MLPFGNEIFGQAYHWPATITSCAVLSYFFYVLLLMYVLLTAAFVIRSRNIFWFNLEHHWLCSCSREHLNTLRLISVIYLTVALQDGVAKKGTQTMFNLQSILF